MIKIILRKPLILYLTVTTEVFPIIPTKEGVIKNKALSAMEHQTDIQLKQIKDQMSLLAKQANQLKERVEISQMIYNAEMRFEPLISHIYHLMNLMKVTLCY